MKFTHRLPYKGHELKYKYDKVDGVLTYRYRGKTMSIYGYFGLCLEDRIYESIDGGL